MTLDCPFCNPLQPRVISVRSYYLTSYGYLRFYWIRSAALPLRHPLSSSTTISSLPLLRRNSSYVRPLGRIPFVLPSGFCRFALTETTALAKPGFFLSLELLPTSRFTTGRSFCILRSWPRLLVSAAGDVYLYIGLILPCSGYTLPRRQAFVKDFCSFLSTNRSGCFLRFA